MKKKSFLYAIISFAVVLVAYCIVFLVVPFPKSASSWIAFGFTVLAICLCGIVFMYAFRGKISKSKLYGFPVFKIALIYAALQLAVGVAICVIAAFVNVPVWIPIVVFVILLALAALGFIATDSAKSIIEQIDAETSSTQTIDKLRLSVAAIADDCTDAEVKRDIQKLGELLRFSDPVSCPETEEAEAELWDKIDQLSGTVHEKMFTESAALIGEITNCLNARNRLCKISKK